MCLLPEGAESYRSLRTVGVAKRLGFCSRNVELADTCARFAPVGVLVFALEDAEGNSTAGTIRVAKIRHPTAIVVLFCSNSHTSSQRLLEAVRDGIHVLARQGVDDLGKAISDAFDLRPLLARPTLLPLVAESLGEKYDHVERFVKCCLADVQMTRVSMVIRALGIPPRTLSAQFERALLPSPALLLMRLRLLRAIDMLSDDDLSISEAATLAGFQNQSDLRGALRRHHSVKPSEARSSEVFTRALSGLALRPPPRDACPSAAPSQPSQYPRWRA